MSSDKAEEYQMVSIWDIQFVRVNEDGDILQDENGKNIIYTLNEWDFGNMAEGIEISDLIEVP